MSGTAWIPGGVYDSQSETGKFHIGDEVVICEGALGFAQLVEEHMGIEAAEFFTELVSDLIYDAREQGRKDAEEEDWVDEDG